MKGLYHCCNYCKWYHPDEDPNLVGGYTGHCEYNGRFRQDKMNSKYLNFYNWGCVLGYQHTIHNHYNLPYPQYANEYAYAIKVREQLQWDIYREKHCRGRVYLSVQDMQNFFN